MKPFDNRLDSSGFLDQESLYGNARLIWVSVPLFLLVIFFFSSCERESQVERASREGVLLLGNSADPKSLDLQQVSGVLEGNIIRSLFEGLIQLHPTEDLHHLPGVALSITPDADFVKWTVKLRPEAKWSDGVPITAEDFRFSYERILTPSFGAKYAEMLYFLKGAEAFNKKEITHFSEVGFEMMGAHEFVLTLRGPTPFFLELLKHYTWYPVPKHQVLKFGEIGSLGNLWSRAENLVGNGPYRIKSYRRNSHLEVERNPNYWNAKNVTLNGIRFLPISNAFTEARMFRDGQLHVTSTAAPEVVDFIKRKNPSALRQEPFLGTVLYRFNTKREPLNDPRVRRALGLSIDREALTNSVFRGFLASYGITPPMAEYQAPRGVSFDPLSAKKLLSAAGFPEGKGFPRLKILIVSRETNAALATAIQAMWRLHLGIEVEIENKEWTAYLSAMHTQDYDISGGSWIGDFIDPLTFLEMWSPGNGNNNTGWANEAFSQKLQASFQTTGAKERYKLLHEAEKILLDELPVAPIAWWGKNYLLHSSVEGWHPLLLDNHPYHSIKLRPNPSKP